MATTSPNDVEAAAQVPMERLPSGPKGKPDVGLSVAAPLRALSKAPSKFASFKKARAEKLAAKKTKKKTEVRRSLIVRGAGFVTNFKAFFNGPYFQIIPPAYEEVAKAKFASSGTKPLTPKEQAAAEADVAALGEYPDFLTKMKEVVVRDWEAKRKHQKRYEITPDDLVPIPFDAPLVHGLLAEFVATVFLIVQSTVVMFLAIMVENTDRRWKDKGDYQGTWQPLIKAIVIIYPLITLFIMVVQALEVTIKKFMYFRLLSMRVLLDWENVQVWQGSFFYYFVCTWIMLNCWAIYGLAAYYGQNGTNGADPTSMSTFIVVNLQTMQLLIQYYRVMTAEQRLVSLNEIFERAPVEAQNLLQYTYIVEEEDVIHECYRFMRRQWRRLLRRIGYLCCCTCLFRDWAKDSKTVRWNVYRLHRKAGNADVLRVETNKLLLKTFEDQGRTVELAALQEELQLQEAGFNPSPKSPISPTTPATASPTIAAGAATATLSPGDVQLGSMEDHRGGVKANVNGSNGTGLNGSNGPNFGGGNGVAPAPMDVDRPTGGTNVPDEWDSDSDSEVDEDEEEPSCCSCKWWTKLWRSFWWGFYIRIYASMHSMIVAFMPGSHSWPFRPDKPYFRFVTGIQLVGSCLCCLMILFGIFGATSTNPCTKGNKSCDQCMRYVENYLVVNSTGWRELEAKGVQCEANFNVSTATLSALGSTVLGYALEFRNRTSNSTSGL